MGDAGAPASGPEGGEAQRACDFCGRVGCGTDSVFDLEWREAGTGDRPSAEEQARRDQVIAECASAMRARLRSEAEKMSNDRCACGGKFRDAEDYRDHLPCEALGEAVTSARVRAAINADINRLDDVASPRAAGAAVDRRVGDESRAALYDLIVEQENSEQLLDALADLFVEVAGRMR